MPGVLEGRHRRPRQLGAAAADPGYIFLGEPKPGDTYRLLLTASASAPRSRSRARSARTRRPDSSRSPSTTCRRRPSRHSTCTSSGRSAACSPLLPSAGPSRSPRRSRPGPTRFRTRNPHSSSSSTRAPAGSRAPAPPVRSTPGLEAGNEDNTAGKHSSFSLRFTRPDGDQNLSGLDAVAPPGFAAVLKGVPYCSEADLAKIAAVTPAATSSAPRPARRRVEIGSAVPSVGAGSKPLYTQGKVYLAGPYKGAPLSLMVVVPGVSGPVRPRQCRGQGGARRQPGHRPGLRRLRPAPADPRGHPAAAQVAAAEDRPPELHHQRDELRPVPGSEHAHGSEGGDSQSSKPFQIANCADLPYGPKLALRLSGGVHRRGHPAIRATFTAGAGRSQHHRPLGHPAEGRAARQRTHRHRLHQGRLRRRRTARPARSSARSEASSPLLDQPLHGLVYLRSSDNDLPDMVLDLEGQVDIEVSAKVDAVEGACGRRSGVSRTCR